jgi:hypothetical protein
VAFDRSIASSLLPLTSRQLQAKRALFASLPPQGFIAATGIRGHFEKG